MNNLRFLDFYKFNNHQVKMFSFVPHLLVTRWKSYSIFNICW